MTGVSSTRGVDLVRSIGADHVIDDTQEDFTQTPEPYDLLIDVAGSRSLAEYRRALTADDLVIPVGGPVGFGRVLKLLAVSLFVRRQGRTFVSMPNRDDLVVLTEIIESGKVEPIIDRTYPLSETAQAMGYLGQGHARAKVVVTV